MNWRCVLGLSSVLWIGCSGSEKQVTGPEGKQGDPVEATQKRVWTQVPKTVDAFQKLCGAGLAEAKKILPVILTQGGDAGPRTVANTLKPYNELARGIEASAAVASLMRSVHPDDRIREAAAKCEQETEAFVSELRLNRQLFDAFTKLDTAGLDANGKRLVEHTLRDFRRAGVDKDEETRKRLKILDEQLVEVGQQFSKNIVDDQRSIEVDPKELEGLPADYIAAHKPGKNGKVKITTDYPDYIPFMSYAKSGDARRRLYIEQKSRGGEVNEKLLHGILDLRYQKAQMLGYADWADYITEDKMMKSGAKATEFIDRVTKVAEKRGQRDYEELLARKRKDQPKAKIVHDWEKNYYENLVKTESYSFDPQSVRPFFSYDKVQDGLLAITSEIYDIEYKKVTDAPVWHEDVSAYDVVRGDEKLGRIYLDMHPRKGKYKHAAQFTLQSGVAGVQKAEGVLVCNFPNPRTASGPALMEHGDVVTMFHEFGHLMHHILGGNQPWIEQSGVATEWDFVEAPSQMFEEWAWDHGTLSRFAKNVKTGEAIGADVVARMRKANKFGLGLQTVQQMFYAKVSLAFHQGNPKSLNMLTKLKELQAKYTPFPYVEGTRFYANFGHLNGYSAMYYTYMWSLVIAKDLLKPFKQHGLMNKEWTRKYRDIVLGQGGTKDAADLVAEFLGRPYSFQSFEEFLTE